MLTAVAKEDACGLKKSITMEFESRVENRDIVANRTQKIGPLWLTEIEKSIVN